MSSSSPPPDRSYWLLVGDVPSGPFTVEQVHDQLSTGKVTWQTRACPVGGSTWLPLVQTPGLGPTPAADEIPSVISVSPTPSRDDTPGTRAAGRPAEDGRAALEHDYYWVLGVEPSADATALKRAFRQRSLERHPDRGGSDQEMRRVLEAWAILSDPEKRRRFDDDRAGRASPVQQQTVAADVGAAREQAEQYPRRWADFQAWLDQVARDFTEARHGSVRGPLGSSLPTAGDSVSGWVFIIGGGLLGAVFLSAPLGGLCAQAKLNGHFAFIVVCLPILGGAWLGSQIHQEIAKKMKKSAERRARQEQARQERVQPTGTETPTVIVTCEKCGQKLRVPRSVNWGIVTCGACKHKFGCRPV